MYKQYGNIREKDFKIFFTNLFNNPESTKLFSPNESIYKVSFMPEENQRPDVDEFEYWGLINSENVLLYIFPKYFMLKKSLSDDPELNGDSKAIKLKILFFENLKF